MTAIRVVFDGKTFVPQQAVDLPAQSEGTIIFNRLDPAARMATDAGVRAYYQNNCDTEDEEWARATLSMSSRAWEED